MYLNSIIIAEFNVVFVLFFFRPTGELKQTTAKLFIVLVN